MKALRALALASASMTLAVGMAAQAKDTTTKSRLTAAAAKASVPPILSLVLADPSQLLAASMAFIGDYSCEFNQALVVVKSQVEGYVDVVFNQAQFTMKPVLSSTGALRLEQVGGPMLLVQIPAKSMLMDTEKGKRVLDGCVSAQQAKEVAVENSLDMNLPGQVDTSNTANTAVARKR
jgi:hypothetical protein